MMQTRQEQIDAVEREMYELARNPRVPLHEKNRRMDELKAQRVKLDEPVYHTLVVDAAGGRIAYDANGVPVDEVTGLPLVPE